MSTNDFNNVIPGFEANSSQNSDGNFWKLYVDGASRNNPGLAGVGIYILKNEQTFLKQGYFVGIKSNNQAEYLALLLGILFLKKYMHSDDRVLILSDSELLVKQIRGDYRVKNPALKVLFDAAKILLQPINYDIGHVLRAKNVVADALANDGVDKKSRVPDDFQLLLQEFSILL